MCNSFIDYMLSLFKLHFKRPWQWFPTTLQGPQVLPEQSLSVPLKCKIKLLCFKIKLCTKYEGFSSHFTVRCSVNYERLGNTCQWGRVPWSGGSLSAQRPGNPGSNLVDPSQGDDNLRKKLSDFLPLHVVIFFTNQKVNSEKQNADSSPRRY